LTNELDRVRTLVDPIASDLGLDLYDVERRGATLRVTLDTPPDSGAGIDLDTLSLATRLISRELDHEDPIPGRYTLEVTSPGLERQLRRPEHYRREVGKDVLIRLRDVAGDDRRVRGVLVAADDTSATVRLESGDDRVVDLSTIDKARTVFEWESKPKPGKGSGAGKRAGEQTGERSGKDADAGTAGRGIRGATAPASDKEKQSS
jgi:ribosome maturation factor RimP